MPTWSGLWEGVHNQAHALTGAQENIKRRLSRILEKPGARELQELMLTLNGATAGSAALATYKRVEAAVDRTTAVVGGGSRTIETVTVVNRNTAAADKTEIDTILNDSFAVSSYPNSGDGRTQIGASGGMAGKF